MIRHLAGCDASQALDTDLCIVGAGAAGLALAAEFLDSHRRVLVLESGDAAQSAANATLNETVCAALPHSGSLEGRARVLGGATTRWGGQLIPLRASETDARSWVAHSGWPFGADTLAPYYRRAERLLG